MFVFVVATGNAKVYPPHGIRVATCDTYDELVNEVTGFVEDWASDNQCESLTSALNVAGRDLAAKKLVVKNLLDKLLGKPWSIYDDTWGYW